MDLVFLKVTDDFDENSFGGVVRAKLNGHRSKRRDERGLKMVSIDKARCLAM